MYLLSKGWGWGSGQFDRDSTESQVIASLRRNKEDPPARWWSSHAVLKVLHLWGSPVSVQHSRCSSVRQNGQRNCIYKRPKLRTEYLNKLDLEEYANSPPKHVHAQLLSSWLGILANWDCFLMWKHLHPSLSNLLDKSIQEEIFELPTQRHLE